MRRALCLAIAAGLWAGVATASDLVLWVPMGDGDTLYEVDATTFEVGRRFPIEPRPHGLAVSKDGSKLYLASDKTGNFQVFDARTGTVTAQVHVGDDPNQITLTRDERFAFVPLRGQDEVVVVRLDPLAVVKRIPSPKRPHDAYTSADGTRVYVGTLAGNTVSVFDAEKQTLLYDIPTADGVRPIEIARDGNRLFAALSNLLGFVVVDPAKRAVTRRVDLGRLPEGVPQPYLDTYTHALQLSRDESELWVTDCINDLLRVVRLSDMKEVAQVRVGHFPHWFALRPDGKLLFVSLWYSDVVAAVDVASRRVVKNIQFPRAGGPKRIAVAPRVRP